MYDAGKLNSDESRLAAPAHHCAEACAGIINI